jgi:hypothetical protein
MKSFVRSFGIAAGFLLLTGVHQASAQVIGSIEFTTTFPFAVGYANVPAGTYTIRPDDDNPAILRLTGTNVGVLFLTENIQTPNVADKTEVVFKHLGDSYVLKDVWMQGSDTGAEATAAEAERHALTSGGVKSDYRVAALRVDTSKDR